MKKILMLLFFTLTFLSIKAQTKEETISWLKEKLGKSLKGSENYRNDRLTSYSKLPSIDINECEIKISFTYWWFYAGGTVENYILTIPVKGVKVSYDKGFYFPYRAIGRFANGVKKDNDTDTGHYFKLDFSVDENLQERMEKALAKLATFCPEKSKEVF